MWRGDLGMTTQQLVEYIKTCGANLNTRIVFTPDEVDSVNIGDVKYHADLDELVLYRTEYSREKE
jgi:hypothetical protein